MAFELLNPMESFLRGRAQSGQEALQATQNATGQVGLLQHLQALKQQQQIQGILSSDAPMEQKQAALAQTPAGLGILKQIQDMQLAQQHSELYKAQVGNYGRLADAEQRKQQGADQQGAAVSGLAQLFNPQSQTWAAQPGIPKADQITSTDAEAIQRVQDASARGEPMTAGVPNPNTVKGLAIQADPKAAVAALIKEQNPAGFAVGSTKVVPGGYLEKQPDGSTKFIETRAPKTPAATGSAEPTPGDFSKGGEDFLSTLPESDRQLVKKIANYDIDPKTLSTKGGHRERMLSLVTQFDPTYDDTQYANKRRAISQFGSGPQGNTVRNLNVAIEHIDTLQRAADELRNGNFTPGNKTYNEITKLFGKTPPTTFEGVRDIVANEVIKGTVGNAGALEDRKQAADKVKAASSPQQLSALFNGWTELMGGQVKGLERQYEASTKNKDFRERYLTQRARDAIGLAESKAGAVPTSALNAPATAPALERATSKSGKPMHKENGQWVYD